jgi:hypothetical protein
MSRNSAGANGYRATIGASLVARASAGLSLTSMVGLSKTSSRSFELTNANMSEP